MENREIEVKFAISSVSEILPVILDAGAVLEQETRFEQNLRWDDKNGTAGAWIHKRVNMQVNF